MLIPGKGRQVDGTPVGLGRVWVLGEDAETTVGIALLGFRLLEA